MFIKIMVLFGIVAIVKYKTLYNSESKLEFDINVKGNDGFFNGY